LEKEVSEEIINQFFLPFPFIAVEDPASVILLIDCEENQIGLDKKRFFIELLPFTSENQNFYDGNHYDVELKEVYENFCRLFGFQSDINKTYILTIGSIQYINDENKKMVNNYQNYIELTKVSVVSKEKEIFDILEHSKNNNLEPLLSGVGKNAACALEEIMYLNSPDRFILEESPVKYNPLRKGKKDHKILRSHSRPIYTLLKPGTIRYKLGLISKEEGEKQDKSPEPHWRRQHYRTFHHDRFTTMKNKRIIVKASWIGPSESIIGNKKYKVILNI